MTVGSEVVFGDGAATLFAIAQVLAAGTLILIGGWGRRAADSLVSTTLSAEDRAKRVRGLRRGAATCQIAGAVLFLAVAVSVVRKLT